MEQQRQEESCVPPGFRFHPTEEELVGYYLARKVASQKIDLEIIKEVDLYRIEPWDLQERCKYGGHEEQSEWYFFSFKDRKYPSGTRTNRATAAGFWKATGRDKAILLGNGAGRRIGLRKTLVFYTGRAPHGTKTDWIMHEYRLDDDNANAPPEDGWVVCRVFKKKSIQRGYEQPDMAAVEAAELQSQFHGTAGMTMTPVEVDQKHGFHQLVHGGGSFPIFDPSMHLPQLTSAETPPGVPTFMSGTPAPPVNANQQEVRCSQSHNVMKLTASGSCGGDRFGAAADWSILDKLLESHQNLDQLFHGKLGGSAAGAPHHHHQQQQLMEEIGVSSLQRLPFHYLGCEASDLLKFSM